MSAFQEPRLTVVQARRHTHGVTAARRATRLSTGAAEGTGGTGPGTWLAVDGRGDGGYRAGDTGRVMSSAGSGPWDPPQTISGGEVDGPAVSPDAAVSDGPAVSPASAMAAGSLSAAEDAGSAAYAVLLDVREPDEWDAGHAPGAVPLPLSALMAGAPLPQAAQGRPLVVICRSGNRSREAVGLLVARGMDAVDVIGGMNAWALADLPVVTARGEGGSIA